MAMRRAAWQWWPLYGKAAGKHPREKGGRREVPASVSALPLSPAQNKFWKDIPEKQTAEFGWVGCLEYMVAL